MSEPARLDRSFPAVPGSPGAVRRALRQLLERCGWSDSESADALLVVSEVATNAVVHAGTPFRVIAVADAARLTVHVVDRGGGGAAMRGPELEANGGAGLRIVDRLTEAWMVHSQDGEQDVTLELRRRRLPSGLRRRGSPSVQPPEAGRVS